jgi:hypothetical protein
MRDARLLERELLTRYNIWLDCNELTGGMHLRDVVFAAIDDADIVLLPLHKGDLRDFTIESDFFRAEMEHTFARCKRIICVMFDELVIRDMVPTSLLRIPVCTQLDSILNTQMWVTIDMKYYSASMEKIFSVIDQCLFTSVGHKNQVSVCALLTMYIIT